ncbi:LysR family transcriptional regulator [Nonomuraea aurantiaca]|uniref:LysR family transcriptional regulator n=1 Tax=Nonomuraea aurantiaca TaxID=2878562 RepID=UPI001CDA0199|nr:LysR family transcriptional regulator [Nonomuraea aurantiaca]MCA2230014.1 LysR family transcriptional regulator [Nonomuraea aurantiaca]
MEIRQLRYFVTVADEGGFARAAERLQIVQPAVSQQVARLERELGVRLFDRSTRQIRLTGAGERLLPEARALLDVEERIRHVATDIATGRDGVLRLGTSQGLGDRLDLVLQELPPKLGVRLSALPLDERLAAVRAGQLDAAFVRVLDAAPGLELLPLWTDRLVVALPAAHPLAGKPVLELGDLARLPLRLAPRADNPPLHDLVLAACRSAGFEPVCGPAFTTVQDTLAEIGTGAASWTILYQGATDLVPARRVALRPLADAEITTSLAVPPAPPGPMLRLLLDAVRRGTAQ